ncbi:MAG TPA: hypothetical protein DCM05_03350 [Elusimicrobia bacterium]|nr:hypothetical protein [Elusimicrobiota bacterium]
MNPVRATRALCTVCGRLLEARKRFLPDAVLLERNCPEHGPLSTVLSQDPRRLSDETFDTPGKRLASYPAARDKGCPEDCGYCPEHGQHVCTGLIEVTGRCDMACPICYSAGLPPLDLSLEECEARLSCLLEAEGGRAEVVQISGGEPLLHPRLLELLERTAGRRVGRILLNTNGERLLEDAGLRAGLKRLRDRVEVYLQFDGFDDDANTLLRGRPTSSRRLETLRLLDEDEVKVTLSVVLFEKNLGQAGPTLDLAVRTKNVAGVVFQRLIARGNASPKSSGHDAILAALRSTKRFGERDLIPLPCSHRECTSLSFLLCKDGKSRPAADFVDYREHKAILSDRIAFDETVLEHARSCGCLDAFKTSPFARFFALSRNSAFEGMKVLRVFVKNFMDRETFDAERARRCCVGVVTSADRIVPFCVFNNLRRAA